MDRQELKQFLETQEGVPYRDEEGVVPVDVKPSARLSNDIIVLGCLMEGLVPKRIPVKIGKSGYVAYGIGDGFGAVVHIGNNLQFKYE